MEALGQRLQGSDHEAFTELFRRMHTPLLRYAKRLADDEAAAYDVLQDVFLKLWEIREDFTVQVSLSAMLYTMVRNRALNLRRRTQRFEGDAAVEDLQDQYAAVASGEVALHAKDLAARIQAWIGALPARRAEAFILSRYHRLRHREIGVIMGISERTVDTHILLALRELRGRLDELQKEGTSL